MRNSIAVMLCCLVCACGSFASEDEASDTVAATTDYGSSSNSDSGNDNIVVIIHKGVFTFYNDSDSQVSDSGVETSVDVSDAGVDSSDDDASAGDDAGLSEPTCETGTYVVGHCLYNMATVCQEYFSDHEADCKSLTVHPMGGSWWPGPCGGEPGTDLHRSSGGCMNECGSITWSYRLGGGPPDEVSIQGEKDLCEAFPGYTYIMTGF